ncbi:hypothetical protein ACHAXS_007292 [Conticribra weissflogii]
MTDTRRGASSPSDGAPHPSSSAVAPRGNNVSSTNQSYSRPPGNPPSGQHTSSTAISSHQHPGTSGRSPPPPRGVGRPSVGSGSVSAASDLRSSFGGGGRTSYDSSFTSEFPMHHVGGHNALNTTAGSVSNRVWTNGRTSSVSGANSSGRLRGTRLSYGAVAHTPVGSAANGDHHNVLMSGDTNQTGKSSDTVSPTNEDLNSQSAFFAALSPSTARFLKTRPSVDEKEKPKPGSASVAAAAALRMAGNAAKGITGIHPVGPAGKQSAEKIHKKEQKDDNYDHANESLGNGNRDRRGNDDAVENPPEQLNAQQKSRVESFLVRIGEDNETMQLRSFVQSLLGIKLPVSGSNLRELPTVSITPDPNTGAFYALNLLSKSNGRRPDDAYLAARAMALKGEGKRAIWILDRAGLIGIGVGGAFVENVDVKSQLGFDGDQIWELNREGDIGGGVGEFEGGCDSAMVAEDGPSNGFRLDSAHNVSASEEVIFSSYLNGVSNEEGISNALYLRTESALLAGQCLFQGGEYERAIAVYEESMRFPPPPPPAHWGLYGYGYQSNRSTFNLVGVGNDRSEEEEEKINVLNERYIRQWREEALSHEALIDDGDDERLLRLAENIRPLPFTVGTSKSVMMEGIHPVARLCSARGIAYNELSNPHRAIPFLKMALTIDARCIEAFDHVISRRLLTPEEEREWVASLNLGEGEEMDLQCLGISWLNDAYISRLRGGPGTSILTSAQRQEKFAKDSRTEPSHLLDASPVHRVGLQTPSMLSLGSPDFAGGPRKKPTTTKNDLFAMNVSHLSVSNTIDNAFRNLASNHRLGFSSDILSYAAIRAYSSHDRRSALTYCTAIESVDPFCRTAGYVNVATLVGLGLKRKLFQLAHRLVDADPKDALAWFAVGSYYFLCHRYDLSQRHFSRSTRLDPNSAECWIAFGCSFAVCDESDQALASFRAAQTKYSGSHVPLLYMGMEYLRTNHLSLAGHFLSSAQKTDPSDPLCCNELGVWSYRRGDMADAAFWFVKALRLHIEAESSALTSTDEALGMNGYILLNGGRHSQCEVQGTSRLTIPSEPQLAQVKSKASEQNDLSSTILCALKTPSGQSIAASMMNAPTGSALTDVECIMHCRDRFWEPTIFNLGQSYRKMKRWSDAIICFEKCCSLCPVSLMWFYFLMLLHLFRDINNLMAKGVTQHREALPHTPHLVFQGTSVGMSMEQLTVTTKPLVENPTTLSAPKCSTVRWLRPSPTPCLQYLHHQNLRKNLKG